MGNNRILFFAVLLISLLAVVGCKTKGGDSCSCGDKKALVGPTGKAKNQKTPGSLDNKGVPSVGQSDAAAVLKIIHRRKSVRHYLSRPVPTMWLEKLVRAGMAAPTAVNKQPWAFIIITERKTLDALGDKLPYAKMIKQTPAAIIVAGDLEKALPGKMLEFWIQDVSAAVENILLAAEAMGLGAVWTGVYPMEKQLGVVTTLLSLPKHIIPLAVIPIGWPKGDDVPKNKWDAAKLHWEKWGQNNKPSLISPALPEK
ncbi:nitroreductase family protein [Myxococcota bacterium]|nr:nitroreductase family protein [Myxococcota bacterium]MBU1535709.1 nitroreductase family protein [Myxococcota bacterium]